MMSFTMQFHMGVFMHATGTVLAYIFLFAYLAPATDWTGLYLERVLDPMALLMAAVSYVLITVVASVLAAANKSLVDRTGEVLESLGFESRLLAKFRQICENSLIQGWDSALFLSQIKTCLNESLALEMQTVKLTKAAEGKIDASTVTQAVLGTEQEAKSGADVGLATRQDLGLSVELRRLMRVPRKGHPATRCVGDDEIETHLPPEFAGAKVRAEWRSYFS